MPHAFRANGLDSYFGGFTQPPSYVKLNGSLVHPSDYTLHSNPGGISFRQPPEKDSLIELFMTADRDYIAEIGYEEANEIIKEWENDRNLRSRNPSLEKSWQYYQTLKEMTKS